MDFDLRRFKSLIPYRYFLILIIFIFKAGLTTACYAQQDFYPEHKFQLGLKGGLNMAHLYLDRFDDRSSKLGIQAGVFAKVPIGTFFSFQPEILYSPKGVRIAGGGILNNSAGLIKLNYIELPLLLNLHLGSIVDVHGGFYTSRLIKSQVGYLLNGDETFKSFDFGFSAGFSFEFNPVLIGMRYSQGFISVAQNESAERLTGQAVNSVIQFYVGFIF